MEIMSKTLCFLRTEEGATATEYSVMIALVILVVIAVVLYLGQTVEGLFNEFGSTLANFVGGGS
jgi:pilus assembly protein Flp/PilA